MPPHDKPYVIAIIGIPGAGKSTLSARLEVIVKHPVIHGDEEDKSAKFHTKLTEEFQAHKEEDVVFEGLELPRAIIEQLVLHTFSHEPLLFIFLEVDIQTSLERVISRHEDVMYNEEIAKYKNDDFLQFRDKIEKQFQGRTVRIKEGDKSEGEIIDIIVLKLKEKNFVHFL
jgi:adenylate kinase family enzyme